jgi:hypothetical protein
MKATMSNPYALLTIGEGQAVDPDPPTETTIIVATARTHSNGLERLLRNAFHSEANRSAGTTRRTIRQPNSHRTCSRLPQMSAIVPALTAIPLSATRMIFHTRIAVLQAAMRPLWRHFPTSQAQGMTRLIRLVLIQMTQTSTTPINLRPRPRPTSKLSLTRSSCTSCRSRISIPTLSCRNCSRCWNGLLETPTIGNSMPRAVRSHASWQRRICSRYHERERTQNWVSRLV